jgi:exonuclease VII small subunit
VENTNEIKADSLQVSGIEEAFEKLREILGKMDEEGVSLEESFR